MCDVCGCGDTKIVPLEIQENLMASNDRVADHNRRHLQDKGQVAINLMGSPGAGKTALLESIAHCGARGRQMMAITGDLETDRDARRIERAGIRAVPITTGTACHLDAEMIHRALHAHAGAECRYVFVENVGNLVCPAIYDLGQNANVVAISVTEGEDKPLKYPVMFRHADLVLLTKTDLLPALPDFDLAAFESALAQVMPAPRVIRVSARTGDGIDKWVAWLDELHPGSATREHDHHHHAGDNPTPRKEGAAHA